MRGNYIKRAASALLSALLVLTSVSIAPAAQVSEDTAKTQSVSTSKYANIVVFVDFKVIKKILRLQNILKEMRSIQEHLSSMFLTYLMDSLMCRILFHSMIVRIIR